MACLSENVCIGRHYAGKRDALSNIGEKVKRLTLRSVTDDFVFNLGTGVPDAAQQNMLKMPHYINEEDKSRLFFARFDGPLHWSGFDTVLQLDAGIRSASLYINGSHVTKIENTVLTALIRVDPYLRKKNSLYLRLDNNETDEDEIIRSLSLYHLPKSRVTDLLLRSHLDSGAANVFADITVKAGDIGMAVGGSVIVSLLDGKMTVAETEMPIPAFKKNHWTSVRARLEIKSPRLWEPDDPHRYTALVQLFRADGTIADVRCFPFGVRELWLKPYDRRLKKEPCLLLNGKPVKIKGAVVKEQNANLPGRLRKMGFNAVRAVGFHNPKFFEACETEGLLVMCETKFRVYPNPKPRSRTKKDILDPLERPFAMIGETVTRFQNNASIFCWSIGSRKMFGNEVLGEFIRSIDDTRAVNCERDFNFTISDFFSASDCGTKELEALSTHKAVSIGGKYRWLLFSKYMHHPLLLCEVSYDRESIGEKLRAIETMDRFLGVFIDMGEFRSSISLKEVFGNRIPDSIEAAGG